MRRNWSKFAFAFIAAMLTVFVASSAMALILTGRSEEMTAGSICDLAGTIEIEFTETDYNLIAGHLADANTPLLNTATPARPNTGTASFVLIRATMGGRNIALTAQAPILCEDIIGDGSGFGADNQPLPHHPNLVPLDYIQNAGDGNLANNVGVEVSDVADNVWTGDPTEIQTPDDIPDVTAYAYGETGDQFFTIYVTDLQVARRWGDSNLRPWIKVGLYNEVVPVQGVDESTAICANVIDFGTLAILNVSLDIEPTSLTYTTSDNQIGHFLPGNVSLRDCAKGEECPFGVETEEIELCPIEDQATCITYYHCVVAEGTYPSSGDIELIVRSNGPSSGSTNQTGVYLYSIQLYDDDGDMIPGSWEYRRIDESTIVTDLNCTFQATYAETIIDSTDIDGDQIQFCIAYQVDPESAVAGTTVNFWVEATTVPCGTLFSEPTAAALLVECGQANQCMYFPYVVSGLNTGSSIWSTGVVVTNLSDIVTADDMEVVFTLTDATGTAFTATKDDFTDVVYAATVDSLVSEFGWEPAAGAAWLWVQGNFSIDGYSFFTNGEFGSGTLPRLLSSCLSVESIID